MRMWRERERGIERERKRGRKTEHSINIAKTYSITIVFLEIADEEQG